MVTVGADGADAALCVPGPLSLPPPQALSPMISAPAVASWPNDRTITPRFMDLPPINYNPLPVGHFSALDHSEKREGSDRRVVWRVQADREPDLPGHGGQGAGL